MPESLVTMNPDAPVRVTRTEAGTHLFTNGVQRPQVRGINGVMYTAGLDKGTAALTLGSSGVGSLTGTYTAYYRFYDSTREHYSDFSPVSTSHTATSKAQFDYTVIPAADPDARADKVQVFRNTNGQSDVYYLDATVNIGTTTATSTNTDAQLLTKTAIRITNLDGTLGATRHGLPPHWTRIAIPYRDRMYYLVSHIYRFHGKVTASNATVTGVNTNFTSMMKNRLMYVNGINTKHTVNTFTSTTSIDLAAAYGGSTDNFAQCTIRPDPKEGLRIYFSESNLPESVPQSQNFIALQENPADLSDITGGAVLGDNFFIFKDAQTHRLYCVEGPLHDGEIVQVSQRGCVNDRCVVSADDVLYVMDRKGIYAFDGQNNQGVSLPIQDLFRFNTDNDELKINWNSSENFFGVHDPSNEEVKFFVGIDSDRWCTTALVFNYRLNRWNTEYYPMGIGSACTTKFNGARLPVYGILGARVAVPSQCQEMDTVKRLGRSPTGVTWTSLSDTGATLSDVPVGTPVTIIDDPTKPACVGQTRLVALAAANRLDFNVPWNVLPTTSSTYLVGCVTGIVRFGKFLIPTHNQNVNVEVDVYFKPTKEQTFIQLRRYHGFGAAPVNHPLPYSIGDLGDVDRNSPNFAIDTKLQRDRDTSPGHQHYEFQRTVTSRAIAHRAISLEFRAFQGSDKIQIHKIETRGLVR